MPVPNTPEIIIHFQEAFSMVSKLFHPISNRKKEVKRILKDPSCTGVNPTNPFLIRINELPHIKDNMTRYTHLSVLFCMTLIEKRKVRELVGV